MWGSTPRVFDMACAYYAERTALVDGERRLTYQEMSGWANRIANGLSELGVGKGDRVGLLMPNCLEFIPAMVGIWKSGAAMTQMPARATAEDFCFFLEEVQASTLIYHQAFDDAIAQIRDRLPNLKHVIRLASGGDTIPGILDYQETFAAQPTAPPAIELADDDLAFVGFTSGTTGVPKGVLQTHATWSHYAITAGLEIGDIRPGEVFAHGAPLTHFTQTFVMPVFMRGGTNVILPGLDLDLLLDAIERERVTATAVVPTIVYMLLDHPRRADADLSSLRTVIYAGSPMAPEGLRRALEAFGPIFVQTYAGTEPGYMTCLRKEDHRLDTPEGEERLASAGRPMYHVDLTIRDPEGRALPVGEIGEICAAQPGQMAGYVNSGLDPEVMQDGWVRSGDIGFVDELGYVFIVDRKKDMIVTGGFNVFPRQIEDVLVTHPAVAQCAVIGVPDDKWGEAVKAVVVTRPGAEVTAEELIALVKERKGSVWAPKSIDFAATLPANPSGKIDKRSLRAPYWAGRRRQVN
ncbi:acyl-CoA synthetase [Nonomuraea harbinensis]|uniref:Long-chain fatty acid--CoA ligase n=1 Tax=Nonomuraea harbinensis TaxID=1286938 RepID=A0ABW1C079_9ACTN|nr:long-chain fatty acid--CoA ligase [Nonomuraea harbinensis]